MTTTKGFVDCHDYVNYEQALEMFERFQVLKCTVYLAPSLVVEYIENSERKRLYCERYEAQSLENEHFTVYTFEQL